MRTRGGKIKYVRKNNELTQIAFADTIGIAQGRQSEIEKGKTKPSTKPLIHYN
jgi:transcriptional regulator with XRE-family HTH domain